MRIILRLLFYAATIGALWWLLPRITASLNRASEAASTADATKGYALFAIYLIVGTILGLLVAWDVSRLAGELAGRLFVGGGRLPRMTPVWWKAARLRREKRPLEAIQVLRDYLTSHPRQWRMSATIAEIYEHDLNEVLPAALEYESLLKQRLPRTARAELLLRLAACQLRLQRITDSAQILQQVITEYPNTAAAEKAERRLARIQQADATDP